MKIEDGDILNVKIMGRSIQKVKMISGTNILTRPIFSEVRVVE